MFPSAANYPQAVEPKLDMMNSLPRFKVPSSKNTSEKRSEHDEEKESDGRTVHRLERSYGAFQRTLMVPYRSTRIRSRRSSRMACFTITLPKPADAVTQKQGRKIEVNKSGRSSNGGPIAA
jgi:hypothetical protein